ncbi:LysR family transcriptional regulator [Methyloligella sp. 2.7D]|uniref:LysR family transcriptional regulator n=1 Tax=unclassified Methyloligella TaxID=2625955 RepID=UPI00157DFA9D|nr:LysR family transcriptional regulator [Methyloligella sp. GL2]QKP77750.1 LysR family transcriptional regulator [Methyloligella sp. GL2]
MLDGLSLDQLRTFIAAAEEGSFSAAGRKLGRAQSVVSQSLANLENQLGVRLFERQGRYPVLTAQGRVLLAEAHAVARRMDSFKAHAKGLAEGLEPELSVAVDVFFPIRGLTCAVVGFQEAFPNTPLRLDVEALGAVIEPVLDGRCAFAIMGSLDLMPPGISRERLLSVEMIYTCAPEHPLAKRNGPIPTEILGEHVQLVLSDRSALSAGTDFGVYSPRSWRLADLGAKHAFLLAGLGFGSMPAAVVEDDLKAGRLKRIELEEAGTGFTVPMVAAYRSQSPPGPAGRWLIERLKTAQCDAE